MTTAAERNAHTDGDADIQRAAPPEWEPGQEGRTLRRLDITIRKMKPLHG